MLRERMRPGSLPVRKGTAYAEQVARGLGTRVKGIGDRDPKPKNIFVALRPGEDPDSGLAKLTHLETVGSV